MVGGYLLSGTRRRGSMSFRKLVSGRTNQRELLGWQDQVGTLERGKFADVIAVPGNPLSDIKQLEHVRFVMKGGGVVKDEGRGGARH